MQTSHQSQGSGNEGTHQCESTGKGQNRMRSPAREQLCRSFLQGTYSLRQGSGWAVQGRHQAHDTSTAQASKALAFFSLRATLLEVFAKFKKTSKETIFLNGLEALVLVCLPPPYHTPPPLIGLHSHHFHLWGRWATHPGLILVSHSLVPEALSTLTSLWQGYMNRHIFLFDSGWFELSICHMQSKSSE